MSDLTETLENRSSTYGNYSDCVTMRLEIMHILKSHHQRMNTTSMKEFDYSCIVDVVNKLIRVSATPDHIDSWRDIAGYATLIQRHHEGVKNAHKQ